MAGVTTTGDARVAELRASKGGHGATGTGQRNEHRWHAVDVAALAAQRARDVRRAQAADGLGQDAGKGAGCHGCAVAACAASRDAAVAEGRVGELGGVLYRQGEAAVTSNVAALATEGPHADMVAWRRNDAESNGRYGVVARVGRAVALHAVGRGGWCVGVDVGNAGHDREVARGVAGTANGADCSRNVIGRFDDVTGIKRIAGMAIGALASGWVGRVRHVELPGHDLRSGLKSPIAIDRVLVHAHPHRIGFVA